MPFSTRLLCIGLMSLLALSACTKSESDTAMKPDSSIVTTQSSTPDNPEKIAPPKTLVAAEIDRGAVLYKRCQTCHTLEKDGRHKVGPNLYGIFGAAAGTKDGFNYSKAMKNADIVWTDENLTQYIDNPKVFMPGNRMAFVGLRKAEDIEQVLDYMRREMEP